MPEKIIGLCRHLPIPDLPDKAWISSKQYRQWIQDNINVLPLPCSHITPFKDWEICFSSDMPRAVASAQVLASDMRLEINSLFREVPFIPFHIPLALPKGLWVFASRMRWFLKQRQYENKALTLIRAQQAVDLLEGQSNNRILVITHGFFMHSLQKKLRSSGYKGKIDFQPEHGKIYNFKKGK